MSPLYEYCCPECNLRFEILTPIDDSDSASCPECHAECGKIFSRIALIRVHHTEQLPHDHPLRVDDRQKMMKDTAVQKALSNYKESQRYSKESPFNSMEA